MSIRTISETAPATPSAPAAPSAPSAPAAPAGPATAATAAAPSAAAPEPGPGTGIPESRAGIDELDARIIALIQERMAVSAGIQRSRLASGGRRVDLAREMRILSRYRDGLGKPGTALAMTLLELCRGRV